jgi:hypothetical protein
MLKRLSFSLECVGLLYMVCLALSLVRLWRESSFHLVSVVGVLSAPAVAGLLFLLTVILVPSLVGSCKLKPPLNVTLPVVYMGLLFLALQLGPSMNLSILHLHDLYVWSLLWESPGMLLSGVGLQVIALTVVFLNSRRLQKPQPVD